MNAGRLVMLIKHAFSYFAEMLFALREFNHEIRLMAIDMGSRGHVTLLGIRIRSVIGEAIEIHINFICIFSNSAYPETANIRYFFLFHK